MVRITHIDVEVLVQAVAEHQVVGHGDAGRLHGVVCPVVESSVVGCGRCVEKSVRVVMEGKEGWREG